MAKSASRSPNNTLRSVKSLTMLSSKSSSSHSISELKSTKKTRTQSEKMPTVQKKPSDSEKSLRGDVSLMEVVDDGEELLQEARDMVGEYLTKKQETIPLQNGEFMHRSHVVLIMATDDIPFATNIAINAKSKQKNSKIVLQDVSFNGNQIYKNPDAVKNGLKGKEKRASACHQLT